MQLGPQKKKHRRRSSSLLQSCLFELAFCLHGSIRLSLSRLPKQLHTRLKHAIGLKGAPDGQAPGSRTRSSHCPAIPRSVSYLAGPLNLHYSP